MEVEHRETADRDDGRLGGSPASGHAYPEEQGGRQRIGHRVRQGTPRVDCFPPPFSEDRSTVRGRHGDAGVRGRARGGLRAEVVSGEQVPQHLASVLLGHRAVLQVPPHCHDALSLRPRALKGFIEYPVLTGLFAWSTARLGAQSRPVSDGLGRAARAPRDRGRASPRRLAGWRRAEVGGSARPHAVRLPQLGPAGGCRRRHRSVVLDARTRWGGRACASVWAAP
jgi:hypothetical protein